LNKDKEIETILEKKVSVPEKINIIYQTLIGNIGFSIFLFLLIKFSVSISIQIKYGLDFMETLDIAFLATFTIVFIFYLALFKFRKTLFSSFTEKIN
jgi:hypothetical protein